MSRKIVEIVNPLPGGQSFTSVESNGSLFSGNELFEPKQDAKPISDEQLTVWNWNGIDIKSEVLSANGLQSVHHKVQTELECGPASIILYDHGKGEIANYIALLEEGDTTTFSLYHCKGSQGPTPGAHVEDVYEVCGQAQKSIAWTSLARFEKRLRGRRGVRYVRGDAARLEEVLARAKDRRQRFEIKVVQPGIPKAIVSDSIAECLGATNGHLAGVGAPFEIIVSA